MRVLGSIESVSNLEAFGVLIFFTTGTAVETEAT